MAPAKSQFSFSKRPNKQGLWLPNNAQSWKPLLLLLHFPDLTGKKRLKTFENVSLLFYFCRRYVERRAVQKTSGLSREARFWSLVLMPCSNTLRDRRVRALNPAVPERLPTRGC